MKTTKTKALVKFDFDVAVITALDVQYKDIQITDGKSYAVVMQGLAEYRDLRLRIDEKHKELKYDILMAGRSLDGDKTRLKGLIQPGEERLKGIRKVWDDEKDRIKEEKAAKEREQIEAIQEKINSIRTLGMIQGKTSSDIKDRLTLTKGIEISEEVYQGFTDQAVECQTVAIRALEEFLSRSLQFEKEEAERKAEAERLEAQRKTQEAAQAKIDEENRKIELAKAEIEEKEAAETRRIERAEWERQVSIKAAQDAKETLERQNKIEVEKLADKWAKEKADREEAEAKEKAEKAAMAPDKEKLIKFADELLNIKVPVLKSNKGQNIMIDARHSLDQLALGINEKAKKL